MVKYWCKYIEVDKDENNCLEIGYHSLEGLVTDIVDWMSSEHNNPEEMLYIYEEHNKSEGFYIEQN